MLKDKPIYVRNGAIALLVVVIVGVGYFIINASGKGRSTAPASLVSPSPADIKQAYSLDNDAVIMKTDILFNFPQGRDPQLIIHARSTDIQVRMELLRTDITKVLDDWRTLARLASTTGIVDPNSIALARQYADAVHEYIDELRNIVSGLTPGNSGLTQAEIDADRTAVLEAVAKANDASNSVGATGNTGNSGAGNSENSNSNTPPPTSPPSGGTSQNTGGDQGTQLRDQPPTEPPVEPPTEPPAQQPADNGPIHLIEGANQI
jgi:hypothetical protein